jgi:hypothetical protein
MGEVQTNHIDAGAHQIPEDRLGIGSRSKSGNDFCAALRWGIGQAEIEWH